MSIKVCFCDDNPEILKILKIRFEKLASEAGIDEYVVDVFDNAQDMIVENTYLQYDAVFMDIEMPGIDGYQAVKLFRMRFPKQESLYKNASILCFIKNQRKKMNTRQNPIWKTMDL